MTLRILIHIQMSSLSFALEFKSMSAWRVTGRCYGVSQGLLVIHCIQSCSVLSVHSFKNNFILHQHRLKKFIRNFDLTFGQAV